jgi:ESS family glutamate:Na+ symporter
MTPTWKLNAVQMLALACLGVLLGGWLKRKIPLLDRLNIPASIVGGLLYAVAALLLRDRYVNLDADPVLRDLLMIAFMTTIGLSARLQLLREGGAQVIWMLVIASIGAVLQNAVGIGVAKALSLDPRLGILAGSVALTGGPATSIAFGGTFEKMGVQGATVVAMASATFGIAVAGLISGYIGGWLIRHYRLKPASSSTPAVQTKAAEAVTGAMFKTVIVIGIAMGIGNLISMQFERLHFTLPAYIGAMIAGAFIRNLDDRFHFARIAQPEVDSLGRIALYLFIAMAMLTLRLWELAHLALPLLVILAAQVALVWLMCITISFWAMGRDYEAAVMSAGFCGFMLGITANAIASMEELAEKYGPARRAFLVVPVVGAFLVDFTNSVIITAMANFFNR